jgi:hypothetical protein
VSIKIAGTARLLQTTDSITERLSCPDQSKLPDSGRMCSLLTRYAESFKASEISALRIWKVAKIGQIVQRIFIALAARRATVVYEISA